METLTSKTDLEFAAPVISDARFRLELLEVREIWLHFEIGDLVDTFIDLEEE